MKHLDKQTGTIDTISTNRIQETEKRTSGIEDTIEKIDREIISCYMEKFVRYYGPVG